jgi:hypothetical protein
MMPDFAMEKRMQDDLRFCVRAFHFVLACGEPIGPIENDIREWMHDTKQEIPYAGCYCGDCEYARR